MIRTSEGRLAADRAGARGSKRVEEGEIRSAGSGPKERTPGAGPWAECFGQSTSQSPSGAVTDTFASVGSKRKECTASAGREAEGWGTARVNQQHQATFFAKTPQ